MFQSKLGYRFTSS